MSKEDDTEEVWEGWRAVSTEYLLDGRHRVAGNRI